MIRGLYKYDLPEEICSGINNFKLDMLPDRYDDVKNKQDYSVLIVRQGLVTENLFEAFPNIKWLQLLNSGYEQIDLDILKKRGILFTNARSVFCKTIAEDAMAKMLVLARNYANHIFNNKDCRWEEPASNLDLCGKTLGILGVGNIGSELAKRAAAFEMEITGFDPFVEKKDNFKIIYHEFQDLRKMLGICDFVVLCLPTTPLTKNIINKETVEFMKHESFLINVARGDIVDEIALCDALDKNKIRAAYIDVCKEEPLPPDSPLWKTKNLFITPHQAAYGDLLKTRMIDLIEKNIKQYLSGKPLFDIVPV
jgi:phosphoglycerate dehydrogenase-like enzyme